MRKARVFLASGRAPRRAAFRARVLTDWAPPLARLPGIEHVAVCLVDATPAVPPWQRPGEAPPPADGPIYDAVVDVWGDTPEVVADALDARAKAEEAVGLALEVEEHLEKDGEARRPGMVTEGVKFLSLLEFHADLGDLARRRMWSHHAGLALAVHVGMTRYVRDVVTKARSIGSTREHSVVHGVAELHFPSSEAMTTRWFASEAGRGAIIQDVGHFLRRAVRLYTTEHVLR